MFERIALCALLAAGCSGSSRTQKTAEPAAPAPTASPTADPPPAAIKKRTLSADETLTTASGATFTASAGWTVEERPDGITLIAPEGDVRLTQVEVAEPDRDKAIATAWKRIDPSFALKVAQAQDLPAGNGWDAVSQVIYVTKAPRLVVAVARRKGTTWFVALADGSQGAIERRGAQIETAVTSLKVKGVDKESFAGKTAHALDAERLAELDRFVEEARAAAAVPGAAVAVVQGGKVVLAKGYGVKTIGAKGKVGPRTLFMIGSVTKPLTTLMMARLVEQKRFAWDTPVTQVMPGFALGDAATTKALQMKHTVCACTGMPRQDLEFIFEYGKVSAEDRLASMKTMVPTTHFGETFQYSNLMVSAGGFAAAHARAPKEKLLPAYQKAMQELVFGPLKMKSTTLDFKRVARSDHASPHPRDPRGEPVAVPIETEGWTVPVAPAGAVWSSADDMARFIQLELGKGTLDGARVISEDHLMARRVPQIKITDEASYGLAWEIGRENELEFVAHNGGTTGFSTLLQILPQQGLGIIILSNAGDGGMFLGAVKRRLLEILFDGKAEAKKTLDASLALVAGERADEMKLIGEADAAWFDPLIGTWSAPGLGRIELRRDRKQGPLLDAGEWKVTVGKKTARDGTVSLVSTSVPILGLELEPRQVDGRTVLALDGGQHQYLFERAK
jgi:CubicO group peptidase (beta-lactamase class C family)